MKMKVIIYTKAEDGTGPCPFCIKAKAFLQEKKIPYEEIAQTREERQVLYMMFGLTGPEATVPQVVLVDEDGTPERVGGFDKLSTSGIESLFQ